MAMGQDPILKQLKWIDESPETKSGAEKGLKEEFTRQTYIVNKDLNQQLKDYAWLKQRSIKDIVEEMMRGYLADKETISR